MYKVKDNLLDRPLVQIYFSPQPSAAIKIKDDGHNFHYEITEHSVAEITLALQARVLIL